MQGTACRANNNNRPRANRLFMGASIVPSVHSHYGGAL